MGKKQIREKLQVLILPCFFILLNSGLPLAALRVIPGLAYYGFKTTTSRLARALIILTLSLAALSS